MLHKLANRTEELYQDITALMGESSIAFSRFPYHEKILERLKKLGVHEITALANILFTHPMAVVPKVAYSMSLQIG